MNALVIKASPLYILKQMPHVSICFRFSSLCLWKKTPKFWTIESIVSPHNSVQLKLHAQKSLWSLWLAVISLYTYVRSTIHYPPIRFKIHTYYNFSHVILLKENKGYFCKTKWWSMVIHTHRLCSFSYLFFCLHLPIQNSATGRGTCLFWIEAPTNNFWGLSLIFSN